MHGTKIKFSMNSLCPLLTNNTKLPRKHSSSLVENMHFMFECKYSKYFTIYVCVCVCVRASERACAIGWGRARSMTHRIFRSVAVMLPSFMSPRAFTYLLASMCLIGLLLYIFHPQFNTKEDNTEGSQVTKSKNKCYLI
jgi:hypothetical protein